MSLPINPLSKYRSYNYQQILIACDTTETAEKLSETNDFLSFVRSGDANRVNSTANPYAKYAPYDINLGKGRVGNYSIIINGMQDAEFVISKAHWYNTVAADAGGTGNQFSTMNIGGEMEISEPQGIRFMNVISKVADQLKSDPSGLIFMLKTIFIGHTSPDFQNDDFPELMTNIKPFLFWIADITGGFTVAGGDYKIEFAGVNHGVTKGQHILRSADRVKINMSKDEEGCQTNTLAGAMCRLQKQIQEVYTKYYAKVKSDFERTTGVDENGKKFEFTGRAVTYVIEAEAPLDSSEYLVTDFKDAATDTAETGKAGIIDLSQEPSVEAAILAIAKRCPKLQEDLTQGDGTNTRKHRYVPKVASTIVSTDTEYKIVYKLQRVLESREDLMRVLAARRTDNVKDISDNAFDNLLQLDYMYTGKNTDILEFDLKMEMGIVLFQNLTTTDNIPTTSQLVKGGGIPEELAERTPVNSKNTFSGAIRPNTPIFLSQRTKAETIQHATKPRRAISFQEQMNRHAALENIEAVVKIHGNPGLLDDVNIPPSAIASGNRFSSTGTGSKAVGTSVFKYWETLPAIVKIDIRMPSVFYGGNQNESDFGEQFWYDGFYYCYAIEQLFDGGEFTQQLHMVSIPKTSPDDNIQTDKTQTDQEAQAGTNANETAAPPTAESSATPGNDPDNMTVGQYLAANSG